MIKILIWIILFTSFSLSQEIDSLSNDIHSSANTKLFADYLFCQKDYLRSSLEYQKYLNSVYNDTVEFKIALSYQRISDYSTALEKFKAITGKSTFYDASKFEFFKTEFLTEDYQALYSGSNKLKDNNYSYYRNLKQLVYASYLFSGEHLTDTSSLKYFFTGDDLSKMEDFYSWKNNPPYKNSLIAAIMSAVIPGSGKIYAGQLEDGLTAFVVNGLFGYLAYSSFSHDHTFRGWLFSGLGAFFYAGNIYGSAAAAQIYNAKISFDFVQSVRNFLGSKNYFSPDYNFCR